MASTAAAAVRRLRAMPIAMADLFCESCASYVHAFLDRCPACGAVHVSRYQDARADPMGGGLRAADPAVQQAAEEAHKGQIVMAFRRGGIFAMGATGADDADKPDVPAIINRVAALTYRLYGTPPHPETPIEASLSVAPDGLRLTDARRRAVVLTVAPSRILTVRAGSKPGNRSGTWAGIEFGDTRIVASPTIPPGDLLVAYASDTGIAHMSIGNRPGLLATKARSGHYEELGRWLGVLAGEAAAERWGEIGPAAHAAELGLGRAVPRPAGPAPAGTAADSPATGGARDDATPGRPTVRASLEELESLRRDGLVTGDEYRRKKDEILRRL
jgi:hypothetical protein